jgi:hypothetical protein
MSVLNYDKVFRSSSGLNAIASSLLCFLFTAYLVYRHRHTVTLYALFLVFVPAGIQIFGNFQRALRLIQSTEPKPPRFEREVFDLLFWAGLSNLMLLIYVAALFRHIDGFI